MLKISEIFQSIMGESTFAGLRGGIVRLSGCNLRCRYCDTQYAYDRFSLRSVEDIINLLDSFNTSLVLVTGGEPLYQEETLDLMKALLGKKYTVLLETNGSLSIAQVPSGVIKIVDIKCPGSGQSDKVYWKNLEYLSLSDELKFVISDSDDLQWATKVVQEEELGKENTVLFSPVFDKISPSVIAEWIVENSLPVRLQLQMHRLIWKEEVRGR